MTTKPDTITIEASAERSLLADFATAAIVIEGSSAFSGSAAFKKAQEVTALVDALTSDGLDTESISIRDVRLEASSLAGIKSSSCRYTLQVQDIPTEILPSVLATIASRKQADLRALQWVFSKLDSEIDSLRKEVIERSLSRAKRTASTLGISILGVYNFIESIDSPGPSSQRFGDERALVARRRKANATPSEIGLSLVHSGKLKFSTKTEFRVSPINRGEQGAAPNP